jgi:hypothetical protein
MKSGYQVLWLTAIVVLILMGLTITFQKEPPQAQEPIPRIKPVESIPEKYNDGFGVLLSDYQEQRISAEEVLQILVLWADKGLFVKLADTDLDEDFFLVERERREKIEAYKKAIFRDMK